ncbi:hypothetical protein ACJIZ3_016780 [Penstemon smallii]|uniref:Bifunctional inhibitor/plant lipid transfer protein/seed storage helical domain-containing protein n=1 Tax=Penstemon smallii TaxID=265156 RepID=A0ABD3SU19_9LAMI
MDYSYLNILLATLLMFSISRTNAQISTPCTSSMISSFTPCLNYITRSSATGSSPTQDCCNSIKSLVDVSMDCTCLILTGSVPFSLPAFINRNLAISLPRMCKSSVPIQCKASGVPLPAPGPVLFGPTLAPVASAPEGHSPKASRESSAAAPPPADQILDLSPESPPELQLGPTADHGVRPVVQPNSDSFISPLTSLHSLFVILIGINLLFNSFR